MNETTKPEASNAAAGRFKPFVSWPRGKYNGRKIQGLKLSFELHLLSWNFIPRFSRNHGEPYFLFLCFTFRLSTSYKWRDE